ncbi:unnamed protein product [Fraxinus pennsylvanica]|uniref:acetate--CoA ligase n=1 Tax=Fraxinus pennsylvanica TaxID=56036 RepID=A0AAD1YUC0_9LAMI|nr:unnamed protein product [Fraxinus pennsylvanica]
MGDVGGVSSNGGVLVEDDSLSSFSGSRRRQPDPASITDECFVEAEEAAEQVVNCIHSTLDSEEKRKYAFPYRSVLLKTYLPNGDIELTALKSLNVEESLARDVLGILQGEQLNENAEYEVKDAQFIDVEKLSGGGSFLFTCVNIVIDISFNQLGGLSTLCFLQQEAISQESDEKLENSGKQMGHLGCGSKVRWECIYQKNNETTLVEVKRNIELGNGEKIALFWEGNEPGVDGNFSYNQLLQRVCQLANYLKDVGIKKGDAVMIHLPMLMELPIAMLVVLVLVVFARFFAEFLAERIMDCKPKVVITCNVVRRGSKIIYLKDIVDAALANSTQNGFAVGES